MNVHEITAKSILRKQRFYDSWFLSSYSLNLYRGCAHDCVYCDGRDDTYRTEGVYAEDIYVKTNAPNLLLRELDPKRKRKPMAGGFFFICGGVSDSYQGVETRYSLSRRTLELMERFSHPVHMLTKSPLIRRDLDLLQSIRRKAAVCISTSISTVDETTSSLLEPAAPPPQARLDMIRSFKDEGFSCGVYLMPLVPGFSDSQEAIDASFAAARDAGADFICSAGMTLKPGKQMEHFYRFLQKNDPDKIEPYRKLYRSASSSGSIDHRYAKKIYKRIDRAASRYKIAKRMPPELWPRGFSRKEQLVLLLDQLSHLADLKGLPNPYASAAYSLHRSETDPRSSDDGELSSLPGIGSYTLSLIREFYASGDIALYRRLLRE